MSQQIDLNWDLERKINRVLSEYEVKNVLQELLKSLVRKGIYTEEEVNKLLE